jgi:hypothetical protein
MFALGTLIGSTTTWRFTSSQEHHDFSQAFDDHASRILMVVHGKLENRIAEAAELSTTITSFMKKNPPTVAASRESRDNSCAIPLYAAPTSWIGVASTGMIFSPVISAATVQAKESVLCSRRWDRESSDGRAHNGDNFTDNDSNGPAEGRRLGDGTWCKKLIGRAFGDEPECQSQQSRTTHQTGILRYFLIMIYGSSAL